MKRPSTNDTWLKFVVVGVRVTCWGASGCSRGNVLSFQVVWEKFSREFFRLLNASTNKKQAYFKIFFKKWNKRLVCTDQSSAASRLHKSILPWRKMPVHHKCVTRADGCRPVCCDLLWKGQAAPAGPPSKVDMEERRVHKSLWDVFCEQRSPLAQLFDVAGKGSSPCK